MDHIVDRYIPEEIALLSLLCNVPKKAAKNTPTADIRSSDQEKRVLTFERERDIVDNLAFLSATDEDPTKVIAVCIEELQGANGLKVILTVNKGNLIAVKNGLEMLFRTLKDVPLAGEPLEEINKIKAKLLVEIVSLNQGRLLCRLRSTHAKTSLRSQGKPPLNTMLAHVLSLTSSYDITTDHSIIETVVECKNFRGLFRQLDEAEPNRLDNLLVDMVKCAHGLTTRLHLERLLSLLPHCQDFQPQARESLLSRMQKVGRYQSASEFLFSAARKYKILKNSQVEVITVPEPITTKPQFLEPTPRLNSVLERGGLNGKLSKQRLCLAIRKKEKKKSFNFLQVEEMFERQLQDVESSNRVHAEIQIIYHYELNPPPIRPRVICSSKSACFLCNLFARTQGKFHIERTHGKLYKKWGLPRMSALSIPKSDKHALLNVLRNFDDELKSEVRAMLQPSRTIYQNPNESIFVRPPIWTPSNVSKAEVNEPTTSIGYLKGSSTSTPTLGLLQQQDTQLGQSSEPIKESQINFDSQSDIPAALHECLVKGKRIHRVLSHPGRDLYFESPSFHISAGPLNLDATEMGSIRSGENAEIRSFEIEWLSDEAASRIKNEEASIVDVETMKVGTEVSISRGSPVTAEGLYMSFKRGIVYFKYDIQSN